MNADIRHILHDAAAHLQDGRLPEAEALYRQVLDRQPDHPHTLHALGLLSYRAGDTSRAVNLLERAVAVEADFADACKNLADIYAELEQPDQAIAKYRQAITIAPNLAEAHHNLGVLLQSQHHWQDAISHFQRALAIKPDLTETSKRLGEVLRLLAQAMVNSRKCGDLPAETLLQKLRQEAKELCNKAAISQRQGTIDAAMAYYQQAIAIKPDLPEAHNSLANILFRQGRLEHAMNHYQCSIALRPASPGGYINLGNVMERLSRLDDAITCYKHAIKLKPDFAEGYNNIGGILQARGEVEQALDNYQRAVAIKPGYAQAYLNAGIALRKLGRLRAAEEMTRRALQLKSDLVDAYLNLALIRTEIGKAGDAIAIYDVVLRLSPQHAVAESRKLMAMHYLSEYSPEDLFTATKDWVAHHGAQNRHLPAPGNLPDPQRRLRLGYVSADLHNHPVGYFIEAVLSRHDKSRYEIFCYYNAGKNDDVTARLRLGADHWRDIKGKSDNVIMEQIRRDGIDILLDLSGHTGDHRLTVFAHKPAPVQATWLGYFDTTGLEVMDYIIADRFVIPPGDERYYVERVVRLPNAYLCFSTPDHPIEPESLPALATGRITFGCFNYNAKLTAAVIACWSKLLHALPAAQLYLKNKSFDDAGVQQRYRGLFAHHGIAAERLRFAGHSPRHELLAAYRQVDIALDPFPYNGGTTTVEALWMGVPTISLRGDRFVSRVGDSILTTAGLGDLVADSEESYIATAVALAADLPRLATLRQELRTRLIASPLCDGPRFTRDLEAAYRRMWETWCDTQRKSPR